MENSIRLLLAILLLDLQQESFFAETSLSKIFLPIFQKKKKSNCVSYKMVVKSTFKQKNCFVIVPLEIHYAFLNNFKLALGIYRVTCVSYFLR